jgi:TetR/AcrR family transcriptional regulator, cholesterol catabolism regulator
MAKIKTHNNGTKKEVIIHHAANLFKNRGYKAASMRELAETMGVEAPSLYNHIGSKSELLRDICFKTGQQFIEQTEKIAQTSDSPIAKLEAIIRFHIGTMADSFNEVYVANHEWQHLPEPALSDFLHIRRCYEKILLQIIVAGIADGQLKNINPYAAVLTILSAVRGLEFWQRNKKNISRTELEDSMVAHLLYGLNV